jgi:hypothetical protein
MLVEGVEVKPLESCLKTFLEYTTTKKWSDIKDHLPRLAWNSHGYVLEIGVRSGISTAALLTGIKVNGGHLWSIDIEPCNVFSDDPDWTFILADSMNGEILELPRIFDVVFIDGNHELDYVLSDLIRFGLLAPKIFLHDTESFASVKQAIEHFLSLHPHYSVVYHSGSYGLAELTYGERSQ